MDVRGCVQTSAAPLSAALRDWLAIPPISADPSHHDDAARSAHWLDVAAR